MKKYLFLDIDGVLNSHRSLFSKFAEHYKIPYSVSDFSESYWNSVDGTNPVLLEKIDAARNSKKFSFPNTSMYDFPFDKYCIENCNKIIEEDEPGIIIISTWRYGRDLKELQELIDGIDLKGKIIGRTGRCETRGLEIYEWIEDYQKKYKVEIESICILDDEHAYDIDYMFGDYTVKDMTSMRNGLREKHIKEANGIFNKSFSLKNIIKQ